MDVLSGFAAELGAWVQANLPTLELQYRNMIGLLT